MSEYMRCCAAKINLLADPLPHSFEGGLRDGFSAISDDKPIDLAARLEERCKLLIKRNQPVSGFALCLADIRAFWTTSLNVKIQVQRQNQRWMVTAQSSPGTEESWFPALRLPGTVSAPSSHGNHPFICALTAYAAYRRAGAFPSSASARCEAGSAWRASR